MISILITLKLFSIPFILAATHWIVTQDGRIAPQMDSAFQLDKSHDLMALLAQEDRITKADMLREELFQKKIEFEKRDDKDSGSLIEDKLYTTDPDCLKVGRKVTSMAIFESTFSNFDFYGVNIKQELSESDESQQEPDCNLQLDFSMQVFEHLSGILQRTFLSMEPEAILEGLLPNGMNLNAFANWVAFNLEKNSTSWVAYNLATLYYRIMGNALKALQCCRLALHFSPREYKTIALVSMGNILIHSHHQEDGIIVLHAAVDHAPNDPIAHYTLANSYALIGDLNRSLLCYENVMKLQPGLTMAVKKMHGIQCLSKLEKALEAQHSVLQNTLTELKDQQKKFEEWNQLQEKIVSAQASVGQRLRSQLEYQEYRLRTAKTPPVHDCEQYEEDGFMFFQCNIKTDMSTLETWGSAMMDLRNRLVDFQTQTDKIVDLLSLRNVVANQSNLSGDLNDSSSRIEQSKNASQHPPKPTSLVHDALNEEDMAIRPMTESELNRCSSLLVSRYDQRPSVILPPELEGFDIRDLLNNKIGLRVDEDHPLPWYPPVCDKESIELLPYDKMGSIKARNEFKRKIRDPMIQRHLLSYVKSNVDDLKETEDDIQTSASLAQVGQRILTALRNKIGPTWLLNTLAALYWRGQGKTSNGIECFRQAISNVPDQYAHIPLTNLAALLLKMDQTQDALRLAALSYSFRRDEPNINFLLGILHLISGNYSHSVVHLQRTLKIQPDYPGAEHHRLLAACLYAEKEMGQKLQCNGDLGSDTTYRTVLRCSKAEEQEDVPGSSHVCEAEVQSHTSTPGSQEVAAIADTEDTMEPDLKVNEEKFDNIELLQEDYLPEGLLRMGKLNPPVPLPLQQCHGYRLRSRSQFTSTWLSVAAKNIDFKSLLPNSVPASEEVREPICDSSFPVTMATMDHLTGVRHRDKIDYKAESALEEALNTLIFDSKDRISSDDVAKYLSHALRENVTSWVLTTAASLYWRVKGKVKNAIDCLRIALHQAPYTYKDIPLISLANVLHRAGFFNDALVSAYMALEISPTFVVIHFTVANIHASRGDLSRALSFYQSTLSLQPSFEPARQRYCEISMSYSPEKA